MRSVYITLVQTRTYFARLLKFLTRDRYNHASISFSKDLRVLYSFGRKTKYNVFNTGFVEETLQTGVFSRFSDVPFCVLEVEVADEEYEAMRQTLDLFLCQRELLKYNFRGISALLTGIPVGKENCYFCSQFVAHLLAHTNWWQRHEQMTKPCDFLHIPHSKVLFEGTLREYRELQAAAAAADVAS